MVVQTSSYAEGGSRYGSTRPKSIVYQLKARDFKHSFLIFTWFCGEKLALVYDKAVQAPQFFFIC